MILIWDNGLGYSAHRIYFVDIGDIPPERVESMLAQHPPEFEGDDPPFVIALCDGATTWRRPDTFMSLCDFAEHMDSDFFRTHGKNCPMRDGRIQCACWISELKKLAEGKR